MDLTFLSPAAWKWFMSNFRTVGFVFLKIQCFQLRVQEEHVLYKFYQMFPIPEQTSLFYTLPLWAVWKIQMRVLLFLFSLLRLLLHTVHCISVQISQSSLWLFIESLVCVPEACGKLSQSFHFKNTNVKRSSPKKILQLDIQMYTCTFNKYKMTHRRSYQASSC